MAFHEKNSFLQEVLNESLGSETKLLSSSFVSGGCINNTLKLVTSKGNCFLKWNDNEPTLFEKERLGLEILSTSSPLKVPEVLHVGEVEGRDFLLLEYIEKSAPDSLFWENFGHRLAKQHKVRNSFFGLNHDNHIGRLPQKNSSEESWIDFFIQNRLAPQLEMATVNGKVNGEINENFEELYSRLPDLIPDSFPSLLHGDLWSGNFMVGSGGEAVIYDPAIYYGHHEAELAFTQMFGEFEHTFYSAYNEEFPIQSGFDERVDLYNLYPLLVHLNLFGQAYLSGITQTLAKYS
ncbi:MAG: fructosamine kinase family protein [Cytophagales bacterium]|nr:fructosamine kinase family protein [Cytophagales bacterium]